MSDAGAITNPTDTPLTTVLAELAAQEATGRSEIRGATPGIT